MAGTILKPKCSTVSTDADCRQSADARNCQVKPQSKAVVQAYLLAGAGFLFTLSLAVMGALGMLNTWQASIPFALLSGVFQLLGAVKLHSVGRADPSLARASVRRLYLTAGHAHDVRLAVEAVFDSGTPTEVKKLLGQASVHLSYIEEGVVQSIEDWNEFHSDALAPLKEDHDRRES